MPAADLELGALAKSFSIFAVPTPARRVFQVVFQPLRLSPG
jgi:hypothetical protein